MYKGLPGVVDMISKRVSAIIIVFLLIACIVPANAASSENNLVRVTKIVVEPDGSDLKYTLNYDTSIFTKVFSLIFGARVIQPSIEGVFVDDSDLTLVSIDPNNCIAKFTAKNQSRLTMGGWYVYDGGAKFSTEIEEIEIRDMSMEKPIIVRNGAELPMFYYRA
ncbi:hypothetical protein CUJ83_05430 [Methanocella sp. CWC-04]|uniref:Uncharacterized protein n=1 Tax=Methanooceanicella nereidis TaxID=2052831 RepID=A0AAP2RD35_9EURY|nr:hypothetical protein [Methanocella sp. CWC-04]MCD1294440.1 hypothetical protein [Methanocella sp. CWC-04]